MDIKRVFVKRVALLMLGIIALGLVSGVATTPVSAQESNEPAVHAEETEDSRVRWDVAIAIAAAIGIPCLAAGYAVGKVGAAALGAASEKPELLGRSLTFVALGEGIAIFGFVLALLLSGKL